MNMFKLQVLQTIPDLNLIIEFGDDEENECCYVFSLPEWTIMNLNVFSTCSESQQW